MHGMQGICLRNGRNAWDARNGRNARDARNICKEWNARDARNISKEWKECPGCKEYMQGMEGMHEMQGIYLRNGRIVARGDHERKSPEI